MAKNNQRENIEYLVFCRFDTNHLRADTGVPIRFFVDLTFMSSLNPGGRVDWLLELHDFGLSSSREG